MLHCWHFVAAPKIFHGPEHPIDVLDEHRLQLFEYSMRIRTECSQRAAWLFLTASARSSLCTGRYVLVLLILSSLASSHFPYSDEMPPFIVCGALQSRDLVE